ncbi:MAG: sulfatase-like hydrolase/transferase [Verrucomicrobiales bacterium]|nr:sulfatase-like hydrolase/transferase [Verrucomicrobiales bacterium]
MRLLLPLLTLLIFALPARAERRPNIVLIMADDMGYECLAANGGETYSTPRLDALAAGGIRFEHCHSQPICTPSRVQIMTGIYNNRNYVKFGVLDPEEKTFGHLFQKAGYKTVIAGKWQLEGGFTGPNHFGFDEYCLWQLTRRPPRFPNPGFEINGKEVDYTMGEYGPDIASDYLCEFFERNRDEEFFAYYPMIPPHFPFQPTPDSEEWDPTESREYPKSEWRDEWFQDMVAYTDKVVGKVVDKLEELGLRENTLIIFTGDNGTYAGMESRFQGRTWVGGKGSPIDSGTRVPLIVNWPGTTPEGVVSESLVDFSDMLPTIARIADIDVPAKWNIDGKSFAREIKGNGTAEREYIYCWYERDGRREKSSEHTRTQQFKLYGTGQFYDIIKDFDEKKPLDVTALEGGDLETYEMLKAALERHMTVTDESDEVQDRKRHKLERDSKKQAEQKKA